MKKIIFVFSIIFTLLSSFNHLPAMMSQPEQYQAKKILLFKDLDEIQKKIVELTNLMQEEGTGLNVKIEEYLKRTLSNLYQTRMQINKEIFELGNETRNTTPSPIFPIPNPPTPTS